MVPFQVDCEVGTSGPISGGFVLGVQGREKLFGVSATDVFYTKIIDAKGELNGAHFVSPKAGCVACRSVAEGVKGLDELFVGNNSSLGQTVHSAANFTKDVSVTDECMEVIFVHDFLGQCPNWDLHIFIS